MKTERYGFVLGDGSSRVAFEPMMYDLHECSGLLDVRCSR